MNLQRIKIIVLSLVALLCTTVSFANDEYSAFAAQIRKEVWAMDMPNFKPVPIPEKYKNWSAVIIASEDHVDLSRHIRFSVGGMLAGIGGKNRQITSKYISRQLVHINDAAALKRFSEFDFQQERKDRSYLQRENYKVVVGVKIYKPNGSIVEVDGDEYLTVTEGKNDKEQRSKLAVPGLQIGDDIDIFVYEEITFENHNLPPYTFFFRAAYPILNYKLHMEIDKDLSVWFRTYNGAPAYSKEKNKDGDFIVDLELSNIDETVPALWYNRIQQSPRLKMYVYNPKNSKYVVMPLYATEKGLYDNPDPKLLVKKFEDVKKFGKSTFGLPYDTNQLAKKLKTSNISPQAKIDSIWSSYYYHRYSIYKSEEYHDDAARSLGTALTNAGVECYFGYVTDDDYEHIDSLINHNSPDAVLYIPELDMYLFPQMQYMAPGDIPGRYQGREAIVYFPDNAAKNKSKTSIKHLVIPVVSPEKNGEKTFIKADMQDLQIKISRRQELKGHYKITQQPKYVILPDYFDSLKVDVGGKTEFEKLFKRKDRNDLDDAYSKAEKTRSENFTEEVKSYHNISTIGEVKGSLQQIGYKMISDRLIYNVEYELEDIIRKAGQNYLLNVGKLLGTQLEVENTDRTRIFDAWRNSTYQQDWHIEVNLPAGYTINSDALNKLNQNIDNEVGAFIVSATVENGVLKLIAKKTYKKKIIKVSEWDKALQVIDAAANFTKESVVVSR